MQNSQVSQVNAEFSKLSLSKELPGGSSHKYGFPHLISIYEIICFREKGQNFIFSNYPGVPYG